MYVGSRIDKDVMIYNWGIPGWQKNLFLMNDLYTCICNGKENNIIYGSHVEAIHTKDRIKQAREIKSPNTY